MKTRIAITGMFLLMAISIRLSGQERAKTMILDEPTFEKSVQGMELKLWIIEEKEKSKFGIQNEKEESGMASTNNQVITEGPVNDSALPIGTHYITINAKKSDDGKNIDESPKILIESPSKEAVAIQLKTVKDNYAGSLTLKEKGEYKFTLSVNINGSQESIPFTYIVK